MDGMVSFEVLSQCGAHCRNNNGIKRACKHSAPLQYLYPPRGRPRGL